MNIHEYQAKGLLTKFGVAVPRGIAAFTPEEAENAARELGGPIWVVKTQIHAGGRRPAPKASRTSGSTSRKVATSPASFISAC